MLEWVLTSTLLIVIVVLLRLAVRGRISARVQYALWLLVLVRLLVPAGFGPSPLSAMNLVERRQSVPQPTAVQQVAELPAAPTVAPVPAPRPSVPEALPAAAPKRTLAPARVLRIVWLAGAALVALCLLGADLHFYATLRRSRRRVKTLTGGRIYASAAVQTPCLFGMLRPAVYLPPAVCGDGMAMRCAVIHERVHQRHGDHIWSVLRGLCLALHWYNPFVWLAAIASRQDAELACDEGTIRRLGESARMDYGRMLIEMTCGKKAHLPIAATAMASSDRALRQRIDHIVHRRRKAPATLVLVLVLALLAAGCTFTSAQTAAAPTAWSAEALESVRIVRDNNEFGLDAEECAVLSAILPALEQADLTPADESAPELLHFVHDAESYYVGLDDDGVTLRCGKRIWRVQSDELAEYCADLAASRLPEVTSYRACPYQTLFDAEGLTLTLVTQENGTEFSEELLQEEPFYSGVFHRLLGYEWVPVERDAVAIDEAYKIILSAADGSAKLTICPGEEAFGPGYAVLEADGTVTCWQTEIAGRQIGDRGALAEELYYTCRAIPGQPTRIHFSCDGEAEEAVALFAETVFPNHVRRYNDTLYFYSNFEMGGYEITRTEGSRENYHVALAEGRLSYTTGMPLDEQQPDGLWQKTTFYANFTLYYDPEDDQWHCAYFTSDDGHDFTVEAP